MGLQKFRADEQDQPAPNGSIAWYTRWVGGPSLAKIQNCPVVAVANAKIKIAPRTVYVRDEYGSAVAEVKIGGKRVTLRGQLYMTDNQDGSYEFHISYDSVLRAGGVLEWPVRSYPDGRTLCLRLGSEGPSLRVSKPLEGGGTFSRQWSVITSNEDLERKLDRWERENPEGKRVYDLTGVAAEYVTDKIDEHAKACATLGGRLVD